MRPRVQWNRFAQGYSEIMTSGQHSPLPGLPTIEKKLYRRFAALLYPEDAGTGDQIMQRAALTGDGHRRHTDRRDHSRDKEEKVTGIFADDVPERHAKCQPGDHQADKTHRRGNPGERLTCFIHNDAQLPRAHAGRCPALDPEAGKIGIGDDNNQTALEPLLHRTQVVFSQRNQTESDEQQPEQNQRIIAAGQQADAEARPYAFLAWLFSHVLPQLIAQLPTNSTHSASTTEAPDGHSWA